MVNVTEKKATEIAKIFFSQYHDVVEPKSIYFDNGTWVVTLDVGFLTQKLRMLRIEASYGRIIEILNEEPNLYKFQDSLDGYRLSNLVYL